MRSFEENLRLYAELAVREGLGLAEGQEVLVFAEIDQSPFVHLVAEAAYRAGAKNVEVIYRDPELTRVRFAAGSDEAIGYAPTWLYEGVANAHRAGAARLGIISNDPQLLADVPADRIRASSLAQSKASKPISEIVSDMAINWSLVGASSAGWAQRVFPELPQEEAVALLWEKIFLSSRVLEPDPIAAWIAHSESLESKVEWLNELRLDAVHFKGPGTDLRVGLVKNHLWAGGRGVAKNGIRCSPNIPTEEVFTMPHRMRTEGVVSSTKPLSLRGQLLDGIRVEFREGQIVHAEAKSGNETLQGLIDTDAGARRLGEVALVPHSSKVSLTETLFLNSLFDENAASHIALGASYSENLQGIDDMSEDQRLEHGANDSLIHTDWMIGSAEVDVDGIRGDGSVVPLMRAGEWV